jgi:LmbE family N-acetylglucosaminyl deacetylase
MQWQPPVLPSYRDESRAVFVIGPVGRPAGRPDHEHSTNVTTRAVGEASRV